MNCIRFHRWLLPAAAGICAAAAAWCLSMGARESASPAQGALVRAVSRRFTAPPPVVPAASETMRARLLQLSGQWTTENADKILEAMAGEPDEKQWRANLEEIIAIVRNDQFSRRDLVWELWWSNARWSDVQWPDGSSLFDRLCEVPDKVMAKLKDVRLASGRRALPDVGRLLAETGFFQSSTSLLGVSCAPPVLRRTAMVALMAQGPAAGWYQHFDTLQDDLRRDVELDVLIRLADDPNKFVNFILHHALSLESGDPELGAAGDSPELFYGQARRIDAIFAAPSSPGRDLLLAAAAASPWTPDSDRPRLTASIEDTALKERSQMLQIIRLVPNGLTPKITPSTPGFLHL